MDANLTPEEQASLYESYASSHELDVESLTSTERQELYYALLSAFPSMGALDQAVYLELGMRVSQIVPIKEPRETVFELVHWAEQNDKLTDLVRGALTVNPGNKKLRAFADHYRRSHTHRSEARGFVYEGLEAAAAETLESLRAGGNPPAGALESNAEVEPADTGSPISPELRQNLVQRLLQLPMTETFDGRTQLLVSIAPVSLTRDFKSARSDLTSIIDQLSVVSQLRSGHWPLLILLDNAIAFAGKSELAHELHELHQKVAQAYEKNSWGLAR